MPLTWIVSGPTFETKAPPPCDETNGRGRPVGSEPQRLGPGTLVRLTSSKNTRAERWAEKKRALGWPGAHKQSLGHSHQLKHVTVRILEINASAVIPIIELAIVEAPGSATV